MRSMSLGLLIALALTAAPVASADGLSPFLSFREEVISTVLGWFGLDASEPPSFQQIRPQSEMGPSVEPNGGSQPASPDVGPAIEPHGGPASPPVEVGPSSDPNG